MDSPLLPSMSNEYGIVQINPEMRQMWNQDFAGEDQLCSTLSKQMETSHQPGLPPMTFFSQISPSE